MKRIILIWTLGLSLASSFAVAAVSNEGTTATATASAKKTLKKKLAKKKAVPKTSANKTSKGKAQTALQATQRATLQTTQRSVSKKKSGGAELSTDVKFDDSVLHGQYQTPDEALAKVEDEKGLSDLLGIRKHFKDRLTTAADQE